MRIIPSESLKETIHGKIIKIEDLNETINHHGKKDIHLAVENNNTKAVESILSGQGKENVNAIDDSGWTPLHYAAQNGNLDMVKLLIKNGAEFKAMEQDGRAPIHIAAFYGRTNIVEFFIDSKIPIDWKSDKSGMTPLHWAAEGGHLNTSRFLVARDANINAKDNSGQTVLHHAVKGRSLEVVEYVSPLVDNVNAKENKNYETPLHYAVKETPVQIPYINGKLSFNLNIIRHLIERHKDIDINAQDYNNQNTPLHYAVENNDYNIAGYLSQQLRQRGIDPYSIKNFYGKTPLNLTQDTIVIDYLNGLNELHMAIQYGNPSESIELLIHENSNYVNELDKDGWPPLYYAIHGDKLDIVKILFPLTTVKKDKLGRTPLDIAKQEGHTNIVSYLESLNRNRRSVKSPQRDKRSVEGNKKWSITAFYVAE